MDRLIIGAVIVLVLFVGLYIVIFNKFIKAKNNVSEAFSGIEIALVKRHDLLSNLLAMVREYADYEKEVFVDISKARSDDVEDIEALSDELSEIDKDLKMRVEAYPDLQASKQYLNLQRNLTDVEEHLQASRRMYNRNVTMNNTLCNQFPSNIIAKIHKFKEMPLFKIMVGETI